MRWYKDKALWAAVVTGTVLRVLPFIFWPGDSCVRDECTYIRLANRFARGQGMTESVSWLWAPGYPAYLGFHKWLFNYASGGKGFQIFAAAVATILVYALARRSFGRRGTGPDGQPAPSPELGRRAGLWGAWLYALAAHQVFFAGRLWSEVLYGAILLGALLLFGHARDQLSERWGTLGQDGQRRVKRGLITAGIVGAMVGICVLFRGVAQYMLPIFIVGFVWRRFRSRNAWLQAAILAAATVVVVAPYSTYATHKFGAFIISDKTLGRMAWLGNNDFPPLTFDYGNGQLSKRAYNRYRLRGRKPCAGRRDAIPLDTCQTEEAIEWIKDNPGEFVQRMPMRVAQLMNPHSLLTRHLRWTRFKGMPQWLDELIILWQAAGSMLVMVVGGAGLAARGRGSQGLVIGGILLYHVAAISLLAGLSRYRVPLEPLLMIYTAGVLADPRGTWAQMTGSWKRWRLWLTGLVAAVVIPLVLWYLPAGWYFWRTW